MTGFFSHLNDVISFFLSYIFSDKKPGVILIVVPPDAMYLSPLTTFKIFPLLGKASTAKG